MKKILNYILLCGITILFFACVPTNTENASNNTVSTMKGVLYTVASDTDVIKLFAGKSKSLDVHVCALEDAVSDVTLSITLKVDPAGVAVYNQMKKVDAKLLPSTAYTFVKNDLLLTKFNKTSTTGKISISANGLEDDQLYVLPLTIDKVDGTDNWELAEQPLAFIAMMQTVDKPEGGDGSMEFPFELSTVADMKKIKSRLSADDKVYFKLMNDIDMASVDDWEPLNYASPYALAIDFDGGGHTISNFHVIDYPSYPSFFGVLNGYCHDVTFMNAEIVSGADTGCGILGGYGGSGAIHADVARVHVHGKVTLKGNKTGVGGMFGCAGNATIEGCSADVDVWSSKNYVGGLIGYSKKVQISNCWVGGSVRGDQRVGGIAGGLLGDGDSITDSYCIAKMWAFKKNAETGEDTDEKEQGCLRSVGGIVGHANQDKGDQNETRMPGNVVSGCIAWQDSIKTRTLIADDAPFSSNNYYSSGAIVAFTATHNILQNCYHRADLDFRDYSNLITMYDQENSSETAPLMIKPIEGWSYNYPYHGKAAAPGKTLTQVAKDLGWSTAIWNFSGDVPTIKPDAQVGPVPDVTGDGTIPGFGDNNLN